MSHVDLMFFTHRVPVLVDVRAVGDALLHARQVINSGKAKHVPRGLRLNAQQQMTVRGETQEPVAEEKNRSVRATKGTKNKNKHEKEGSKSDRASGVRQARRSVRRQHRRHFLNARQHA